MIGAMGQEHRLSLRMKASLALHKEEVERCSQAQPWEDTR
jgi:hypothetical protein